MTVNTWFSGKECNALEIKKYVSLSDDVPTVSVRIHDSAKIQELMSDIEKMPVDGNEMISFGKNAEKIELIFGNGNDFETIQIYNGKFKTPSTGFNASDDEIEKKIYGNIMSFLSQ